MSDTLGRILGHARKYSFRRAERKFASQSSLVTIHNLKSSRDDGILYPDDQLNDVADDREQIIAVFEENYSPIPHMGPGDVTSTSSVCTDSPDLFSVEVGSHCSVPYTHSNNVEVAEEAMGITPLQVRRGSEPALNCLFPTSTCTDPNKRWSTAVVINTEGDTSNHVENGVEEEDPSSPLESLNEGLDSKLSSLTTFSRGSGRLSILGNTSETYRWVEAADRQLIQDLNENFSLTDCADAVSDTSSLSDGREKTIILKNESGPLGIHVVPDLDSKGRETGLLIQTIESGGRIDRDGRFRPGDRIIEINGRSLREVSFQTAQEIFREARKAPHIRLELLRGSTQKPPPPIYPPKPPSKPPPEDGELVDAEERAGGVSTKVATVTPTKKIPKSAMRRLASTNTRKMGKMLNIDLSKGSKGLGFSITTRDNPAGGNSPIYIKNVLLQGAAIEDGRLQPGDRLLEVNGVSMTGKTQSDAASILRNIPLGKPVHLVVSRQEVEETEPETEPESTNRTGATEDAGIFPWKFREILTFQIPLDLNPSTQSGGLGVSVKGKSTLDADLGIFVKGVIHGGAAAKDGRLQTDDQLVNINGLSLLGMSNTNAMSTLKQAMSQTDGPIKNAIILTIARRIPENPSTEQDLPPEEFKRNGGTRSSQMNLLDEIQNMKNTPGLPGCNPVIERLTGNPVNQYSDDNDYMNKLDDKKPYAVSLNSSHGESVLIEGEYDPKTTGHQVNGSVAESLNALAAGSQLSLDESNPGFARDGFGRQSMSEKRHAQLDARNTDTYQRSKKAREERDRMRQQLEQEYQQKDAEAPPGPTVGPSLGLRKSSSLESLQTMLQELNKDDEAAKRAAKSARSVRSRGCNESFRAAVDRSYDAPASPTMDTLEEESESGSHILTRSVELVDTLQDDLLSIYCRNSKSKKKSLFKGLGNVFKFGKSRKQSQDLKGKEDEGAPDSDYVQHMSSTSKDLDRNGESDGSRRAESRQERMQSLREQYQRLHQRRQGQYPQEHQEELYEHQIKEKESNYALPYEIVHGRSQSLDLYKESSTAHSAKVPSYNTDPNRYSHYMNYKEIQQHISQRGPNHHPIKSSDHNNKPLPPDYHHLKKHSTNHEPSSSKPHPPPPPDVFYHQTNQHHRKNGPMSNHSEGDLFEYQQINQQQPPRRNGPISGPEGEFYESQQANHKQHGRRNGPISTESEFFENQQTNHQQPLRRNGPESEFFEYQQINQHLKKQTSSSNHSCSSSEVASTSSLTRGSHMSEHGLQGNSKSYYVHDSHEHGNYGRMGMHHFYPNSKLYSHIVPGSKV